MGCGYANLIGEGFVALGLGFPLVVCSGCDYMSQLLRPMHCNIFVADIIVGEIYGVKDIFAAEMPASAYIIYHMIN